MNLEQFKKLKPGDIIQINNLRPESVHDGCCFRRDMVEFKILTVKDLFESTYGYRCRVEETSRCYSYPMIDKKLNFIFGR